MYDNAVAIKIAEKYKQTPLTNFGNVNQRTLLESVNLNWRERDLPEKERTKHVHRLHPYMGKFVPQLVEIFLRKYKQRLGKELKTSPGNIAPSVSREYKHFKKEYLPKRLSIYEKLCNASGKILKISPDAKKAVLMQEAIDTCHYTQGCFLICNTYSNFNNSFWCINLFSYIQSILFCNVLSFSRNCFNSSIIETPILYCK